ncbi:hypothetical protein BD410DRAFT_794688 [Rickenella mellea]|uniref:Uncharacterized protein n=1 Tax=Rickenella mellea TaxID=50990 RepID=A0A4Y7PNS5_9AGAM|nr:hypothetical protein BD410DRAFT_794688 [Rickenella mellea]
MFTHVVLWLSFSAFVGVYGAQIPGLPDVPGVSISAIGTGSDGRTTYQIVAGSTGVFVGTATLALGPTDASLTYAAPEASITVGETCQISAGVAVCVVVEGSTTITATGSISGLDGTQTTAFSVDTNLTTAATATPKASSTSPAPAAQTTKASSGEHFGVPLGLTLLVIVVCGVISHL